MSSGNILINSRSFCTNHIQTFRLLWNDVPSFDFISTRFLWCWTSTKVLYLWHVLYWNIIEGNSKFIKPAWSTGIERFNGLYFFFETSRLWEQYLLVTIMDLCQIAVDFNKDSSRARLRANANKTKCPSWLVTAFFLCMMKANSIFLDASITLNSPSSFGPGFGSGDISTSRTWSCFASIPSLRYYTRVVALHVWIAHWCVSKVGFREV